MRYSNSTETCYRLLGLWVPILTGIATLITFFIAFRTEPLSGPFCLDGCFVYPFTNITSRFPADYLWMYPAMGVMLLYVILMSLIHFSAHENKKIYSQTGLLFALSAFIVLAGDYFVQLSVIQPSLLLGEDDGIALLSQFNPHGLFIALEEFGFLLMSISFIFMAPVFADGRLQRVLRWTLITSFILNMVALVWIAAQFGVFREYRYEIASISINWLTLIIVSALLVALNKKEQTVSQT